MLLILNNDDQAIGRQKSAGLLQGRLQAL